MITWRARAYKPRESTPQPHTGHHWASREHAGALRRPPRRLAAPPTSLLAVRPRPDTPIIAEDPSRYSGSHVDHGGPVGRQRAVPGGADLLRLVHRNPFQAQAVGEGLIRHIGQPLGFGELGCPLHRTHLP